MDNIFLQNCCPTKNGAKVDYEEFVMMMNELR